MDTAQNQLQELKDYINAISTTAKLIGEYEIKSFNNTLIIQTERQCKRLTLFLSPNKTTIHLLTKTIHRLTNLDEFRDWTKSTHQQKIDHLQEILQSL